MTAAPTLPAEAARPADRDPLMLAVSLGGHARALELAMICRARQTPEDAALARIAAEAVELAEELILAHLRRAPAD